MLVTSSFPPGGLYKMLTTALGLLALSACGGGGGASGGDPPIQAIATTEFVQMASSASCANLRNRLFVIDRKYVFWDKAGTCADAAYAQTLFGTVPQSVLCSVNDSIAGPHTSCPDSQQAALMQTMIKNLDKADLGLGGGHQVQPITVPGGPPAALKFSGMNPRFYHGTPPGSVLIRDAAAWRNLLQNQPSGQPVFPEPDFSRQMVLGVFSRSANACNKTRIAGISSNGQQLTVEFVDQENLTLQACDPLNETPMSLALLDASPLPPQFVNITAQLLPFRTLAQSQFSAIKLPQNAVLKDAPSWSLLWNQHTGGDGAPQPTVDFASKMVAAIFLGGQNGGCNAISEITVWRSQGRVHVAHFDTIPGPTSVCTAVITSPAAMIELEKSDETVNFVAIPRPL